MRSLAPEATAFALIGVTNAVLYFAIFNAAMLVGAIKATVLATVVTTTLAYVAHRYWTYRARPRSTVRREYALFFAFNLAGMLIQSGVVGIGKYGFGLDEYTDRLMFNLCTVIGIGLATVFRFYVYRTLVFRPHPVDHALPTNTAEAIAEEVEIRHLAEPLEAELGRLDEYDRSVPGQAA